MTIKTTVLVVAAAMTIGWGCLSTGPDPGQLASAVVTGRIVRPDGVTGVGGPLIDGQLISAVNGGSANLIATLSTLGTDNGQFTFHFKGYASPQTGSVIISVTPAPGQGLVGLDTSGIPVRIFQGDTPAESTYVQIMLKNRQP
jgi:hypothetical protein